MSRSSHRFHLLALLAVLALVLFAAGCGGDDDDEAADEPAPAETEPAEEEPAEDISGTVAVMGVWTGDEQASFEAVLEGFREQYPDVTVNYNPAGDQLPTVLSTAIEGGNPPDVATIPQPGLMRDLVGRGALQPLDFAREDIEENFAESWVDLGTVDGTLHGLFFKGANKSTIWYNVQAFEDAGVEPPETWDALNEAAQTLNASGVTPYSIGAADGWTLTDLFENIYLRTAGPDLYDQLSDHEIPWTHESVTEALEVMRDVVGDPNLMAGGRDGALQTDFPTSVTQVFSEPPAAAMVIEGDFVGGVIRDSTDAEPGEGFNVFTFPSIEDSPPAVMGAGDAVVLLTENEAAQALIRYLATPEAAQIWAERGGFSSPNRNLDTSVYPDEITQQTAGALGEAEIFRFDLSDLQPAAFGGTVGQGLFALFQDFVRNPDNMEQIQQQMEQQAAAAHGNGGNG
jgi:alpha-glucoside transport system substrate-binding protein